MNFRKLTSLGGCLFLLWLLGTKAMCTESASMLDKAKSAIKTREYARAIQTLTPMINKRQERLAALKLRAIAYHNMGQYDKSLADINEVLKLAPRDYVFLGSHYAQMMAKGNAPQALADVETMIAARPQQAEPYVFRADVHQCLKQWDLMIADCRGALKRDPNNDAAHALLAAAYARIGWTEAAYAEYQKSYKQGISDFSQVAFPNPEDLARAQANLKKPEFTYPLFDWNVDTE